MSRTSAAVMCGPEPRSGPSGHDSVPARRSAERRLLGPCPGNPDRDARRLARARQKWGGVHFWPTRPKSPCSGRSGPRAGLARPSTAWSAARPLIEHCPTRTRVRLLTQVIPLPRSGANPDAEDQPAVREVVERDRLAGELDRTPARQWRDQRADPVRSVASAIAASATQGSTVGVGMKLQVVPDEKTVPARDLRLPRHFRQRARIEAVAEFGTVTPYFMAAFPPGRTSVRSVASVRVRCCTPRS